MEEKVKFTIEVAEKLLAEGKSIDEINEMYYPDKPGLARSIIMRRKPELLGMAPVKEKKPQITSLDERLKEQADRLNRLADAFENMDKQVNEMYVDFSQLQDIIERLKKHRHQVGVGHFCDVPVDI